MGGCRCHFRDCCISSARHPKMHFFHFPVRDNVRFAKWIKMAGAPHILNLTKTQQRNRAVCMLHFRDECFMNYKKDKLTNSAVPTLVRLGPHTALDYATDDKEPRLVELPEATLPHLTPPPGYQCPIELYTPFADIAEAVEHQSTTEKPTPKNVDHDYEKQVVVDDDDDDDNEERLLRKKPKITEFVYDCELDDDMLSVFEEEDLAPKPAVPKVSTTKVNPPAKDNKSSIMKPTLVEVVTFKSFDNFKDPKKPIKDPLKDMPNKRKKNIPAIVKVDNNTWLLQGTKEEEELEERITLLTEVNKSLSEKLSEIETKNQQLENQNTDLQKTLKMKTESFEETVKMLNKKVTDLSAAYNSLQKEQNLLKMKNDEESKTAKSKVIKVIKHATTMTEAPPTVAELASAEAPTSSAARSVVPTKVQLFNGIKRYLSTSMVALLRMEMFSSSEREWKSDERRTALDLLRLGESVYKYFIDEWRFRLPSLRTVRQWADNELNEGTMEEDL